MHFRTKYWRTVLVASLPAFVVLGGLWLFHQIPALVGLLSLLAVFVGTAWGMRLLLADLRAIDDYAAAVGRSADAPLPGLVFREILTRHLVSVRRLARTLRAQARSDLLREGASGLDQLPDPVLMLDSSRRILMDNVAARDLLGADLVGRSLPAVLRNPNVLGAVELLMEGEQEMADVEFSFRVPVERHFSARIARLAATETQPIAIVIALHDMTVLKRAEAMRSDFVANASHELRTPISVLLGGIQTLQGSARDDAAAREKFLALMEEQAERMARLVDDLLALSRIELEEHAPPADSVDLRQIAVQVIAALDMKAVARGITVHTEFAPELPAIVGDKGDLYRALQNLIDNALKYAAENSAITVSAGPASEAQLAQLPRANRYVALSVSDHGEGIAPEHLPRLTERFYRVDTARSRQLGGTGLGLAIVKHVAARHRGRLLIDSVQGEGSVFTLVLPVGKEPAKARGARETAGNSCD